MKQELDRIKGLIARFQGERPYYSEILALYKEVVEVQWGVRRGLRLSLPQVKEDGGERDKPLIGKEGFSVDVVAGESLFYDLCKVCSTSTRKMAEEVPRIAAAAKEGRIELTELLSRHYDRDYITAVAQRGGIDAGVLSFLIGACVKPGIEMQAEKLRDRVDLQGWLRGDCPLCGSPAQIAILRGEGGERYLQCALCALQWRMLRIACPYCDNRDAEMLSYLSPEGEDAYRVELCDRCRGYIKTVDARRLDYEPYLELEDIITIHLDILAIERGYRRSAPSPWGPTQDRQEGGDA